MLIVSFYVLLQMNVNTCSKREGGLVDRTKPFSIDTIIINDKIKREFVYDGEKADHYLLSNGRRVYLCTIDPEIRGESIYLFTDSNYVVFVHSAPSFFDSDKIITKDSIVYLIETLEKVYP